MGLDPTKKTNKEATGHEKVTTCSWHERTNSEDSPTKKDNNSYITKVKYHYTPSYNC